MFPATWATQELQGTEERKLTTSQKESSDEGGLLPCGKPIAQQLGAAAGLSTDHLGVISAYARAASDSSTPYGTARGGQWQPAPYEGRYWYLKNHADICLLSDRRSR